MEIMNGACKLVTRNHLTRKKLLAQKQRFGGKKGEKSQRSSCLQTNVFYTEINGGRVRAWKPYKTEQRGENSY